MFMCHCSVFLFRFFLFKQKTAYEIRLSLVGSEMCIRDRFTDWVQLGFVERQGTFGTRYPKSPGRQVLLMSGLEVCAGSPPANSGPLSELPPGLWAHRYTDLDSGLDQARARVAIAASRMPLTALVSYEQTLGAPSKDRGLGLHQFC